MEVKKAELAAVGVRFLQYPQDNKPELAFVGRSNVGKSTLINALLNRKSLARTSSAPGKTRTINFYGVNDAIYIVDLPGYGYARAPKREIEKWGHMIEEYLHGRQQLQGILLLLDIRHEPNENDRMMYDWLRHYGYPVVIVATKSDKLKKSQLPKHLAVLRRALSLKEGDRIVPFSGLTKAGVPEVWAAIDTLLAERVSEQSEEEIEES